MKLLLLKCFDPMPSCEMGSEHDSLNVRAIFSSLARRGQGGRSFRPTCGWQKRSPTPLKIKNIAAPIKSESVQIYL